MHVFDFSRNLYARSSMVLCRFSSTRTAIFSTTRRRRGMELSTIRQLPVAISQCTWTPDLSSHGPLLPQPSSPLIILGLFHKPCKRRPGMKCPKLNRSKHPPQKKRIVPNMIDLVRMRRRSRKYSLYKVETLIWGRKGYEEERSRRVAFME